jgi:uncharacterized damage-inducible protein DinB
MDTTLKRLLGYHSWAMDRLFHHIAALPAVPQACLKLSQHVVNAESIWVSRIKGEKPVIGVWEERPFEDCLKLHQRSMELLKAIIEGDQDLECVIDYVTTNGDPFSNSIHDILIHVLNHATYHRAQIAKELRLNRIDPVNTDYILYVRS